MNNSGYLQSIDRLFRYYKSLGEKAIAQIGNASLFVPPNEDSNSVATIIKHLNGNMLSRWTDFLTSDGEKEWRKRDEEFENGMDDRDVVMKMWEEGWNCLFGAINSLTDEDLQRTVYIRNEGHTVMDAINRQLAHYSYHVGQIIYAAKMLKDDDWISLSIPKNKSKEYNKQKFSEEKGDRHFTEEWLGDEK